MRFVVYTLFPDYFDGPLRTSLVGKAIAEERLAVDLVDFRDYATDRHRTVDEPPYGGGPGMVLKPEPIVAAFEDRPVAPGGLRVYLTPWGEPLGQERVEALSRCPELHLLCGRYEGVDERVVDGWIDLNLSVGDFVLAGGEAASLCLIEAVGRYVPGVLGEPESLAEESFARGLLEGPQYTRPADFRGRPVPDVLLSGDHGAIARWRAEKARERTRRFRPELLDGEA